MWPKALLQLLELVPHFSRLLPMADKFLQSKATLDDATLKTIGDLRGELGQANASHAGLYRQMNEQSEKLANALTEIRSLRSEALAQQAQIAALDKKLALQRVFVVLAAVASLVSMTILIVRH